MSLSPRPLSYCTNVHPGRSVAEVELGLDNYTTHVRDAYANPLAAGLWLAQPVVQELLATEDRLPRFADRLNARDLTCYTLNAFPYGDFHSERVKENVYLPDWSQSTRLDYTVQCAQVLAALLPEDCEGSLSTVPLGFKQFEHADNFFEQSIEQLITLAHQLQRLHDDTGRRIRLAIEPEPFCLLETTDETLAFFEQLRQRAGDVNAADVVQEYIGVCYDVCHQAVEFEDVAKSIAAIDAAGVRINKVHITCALQLDRPDENAEGRQALARYVEPRYLHQTMSRGQTGAIQRVVDLTQDLALEPTQAYREADVWRIHFHVPVDAEQLGPLKTTRTELKQALAAVKQLDYDPHLEVETYTWEVLPDGKSANLVEGLTRELSATRQLLDELQSQPEPG